MFIHSKFNLKIMAGEDEAEGSWFAIYGHWHILIDIIDYISVNFLFSWHLDMFQTVIILLRFTNLEEVHHDEM